MELMNFFRSPDNKNGGGHNLEKIKNYDKWVVPFYQNEISAIKHTIDLLREKFDINESNENIKNQIIDVMQDSERSDVINLNDDIWSKIENSESYDIREGEVERAKEIVEKNHHSTKGFEDIRKKKEQGGELSMPTILKINDRYFLISGETRLLESKVYGTNVKVILGELDVSAVDIDPRAN